LIGMIFSKPETKPTAIITPITQPVQPVVVTPVPVQVQQPVITQTDPDLKQKVAAIELSQQSVRSEVSAVNNQVSAVSSNLNNLNTEISHLNQVISNLSAQVAKQSDEISVLMARSQPKPIKPVVQRVVKQPIIYYIQAVIPGRAWLIGSNGSTLTVREGTRIYGYGVVKLIDSMQGRILTSSGQVIKFSQEDS